MTINYESTVTDILINLFKDNVGDLYKQIFFGDPLAVPQSMLPAICIEEDSTAYELGATQFDDVTHSVTIKILLNKKDDFGKPAKEVGITRKLQQMVQGRDKATGQYATESIIGILRKNLTEGNLYIESIPRVNFGVVPREDGVITAEAHLQVNLVESLQVSGRS